jgi:uncharacterized protein with GYD domain
MPTYIALVNWTDQGAKNARATVPRAEAVDSLAEKHGASLQLYWTVGPYDLVGIIEAPDDESVTAFVLDAGSGGNVRTTTMRAYDRGQMLEIIKKLD